MTVFSPTSEAQYLGYVELAPPAPRGLASTFFSTSIPMMSGRKKFAFDRITTDDRQLATFVDWELDGVPLGREDFKTVEIEPALMQFDDAVPVEEQFERMFGEDPQNPFTAEQRHDMIVSREVIRRETRMWNSAELMAAGALQNGQIILKGNRDRSPPRTLDVQRDANNSATLVGGTTWSDAGADPLETLRMKRTG